MISAHLTSCQAAYTDAAQEQGSEGHAICFIKGQRSELHFCHFVSSREEDGDKKDPEATMSEGKWWLKVGTQWWKKQLFFPITCWKNNMWFPYDPSQNLWKFMKGRKVTTKTNILFIAWKYFAAFPYVSFSRLSVTWDEASWMCLHVFPVLVHGKKWTVGQEYQTAYVKLCSWHECKAWCQKTWPFVEVYLRSKKQITGSW